MKARRWAMLGIVVAGAVGLSWAFGNIPTVHRFRLEAPLMFDGQPYTAIGYMECSYRRAWFVSGSRRYQREGPPIKDGYYTETFLDAASVVLPDGLGAILIPHGGTCPSLPSIKTTFAVNPASASGAVWPAYYFPDRNDPKVVWILHDRRPTQDSAGRFVLKQYLFVTVTEPVPISIAENVPIAWRWYQDYSAKYRKAMSGGGGSNWSQDAIWRGIYGCVMYEDEWQSHPDYARAASGLTATALVSINEPGREWARNCSGSHISLVPSSDYSKATLELDRTDLRWATITTPHVPEYRDRSTGQWTPEICIAEEGCTGVHWKAALWLYLPSPRVFVRLEQQPLESFHFSYFAVRPGDGL